MMPASCYDKVKGVGGAQIGKSDTIKGGSGRLFKEPDPVDGAHGGCLRRALGLS